MAEDSIHNLTEAGNSNGSVDAGKPDLTSGLEPTQLAECKPGELDPAAEVKASNSVRSITPGQCCIPPPPCDYQGLGTEETWLDSLPVYITSASKSPDLSAVLIISDIYGWRVPQTREMADKIAAAGQYFVVVPDFMENDFFASSDPNDEYAGLQGYLARHSKPKAIEEAKKVLKKLESMGFNAIGVAGFCWGAKILVSLLKGDTPIAAAIMCHPSFLTTDDIKVVKVPLAILGAEIDIMTTPEQVTEYGAVLRASPDVGSQSYVKIYKGADHGWTTRYDLNDPEARIRAETAHDEIISWFKIFLNISGVPECNEVEQNHAA